MGRTNVTARGVDRVVLFVDGDHWIEATTRAVGLFAAGDGLDQRRSACNDAYPLQIS